MSLDDIPDDKIVGHAQMVTTPYVMDAIKYQFYVLLKEPIAYEITRQIRDETIINGAFYAYNYEVWDIDEKTLKQLPDEMRKWILVLSHEKTRGTKAYCLYITVEEDFEPQRNKQDLPRDMKAEDAFKAILNENNIETVWTHAVKVSKFPWERPKKGRKIPLPAKLFKKMIKDMEEIQ